MIDWTTADEREGVELLIGRAPDGQTWWTAKGPGGAVTIMRLAGVRDHDIYDFGIHYPAVNRLAGHDCPLVEGGRCDFIARLEVGMEIGEQLALTSDEDRDETRWRLLLTRYREYVDERPDLG